MQCTRFEWGVSKTQTRGRGRGRGRGLLFFFFFFFNFNFCFFFLPFLPLLLLFCFFCCLFFFMIIMAILNGSGQIVKHALGIMGCLVFNHFFPLKWSRDKPSLFTRWKDKLNHGRRRGCSFLFKNLLVKGTIIAACMLCFLSFLGRV